MPTRSILVGEQDKCMILKVIFFLISYAGGSLLIFAEWNYCGMVLWIQARQSVRLSVRQLPTFLRIGSLFFSDFFSEVRGP